MFKTLLIGFLNGLKSHILFTLVKAVNLGGVRTTMMWCRMEKRHSRLFYSVAVLNVSDIDPACQANEREIVIKTYLERVSTVVDFTDEMHA